MRRLKTTIALWYLYIVGGIKAIFRVILTDEDFTDEHYEMMLRGLAVKKQKSKKWQTIDRRLKLYRDIGKSCIKAIRYIKQEFQAEMKY